VVSLSGPSFGTQIIGASAQRLTFTVHNATNADVSIPRNRVRAELLPLLEQRFNPAVVEVLAGEADLARELWSWVDAQATDLAARLVRPVSSQEGERVREIDVASLSDLPLALRRAVLHRALSELAGVRPISFGHVDAAVNFSAGSWVADAARAPCRK